ncbi:MAG: tetratricopeptide repeat protein, partial [Anaerolineales bacterium]
MSKVALRVYNREIETLVDQGHIEEAIAHCQHILKLYPKHLETYRLLGKAYLEARRHPDAADIFQRVLMTVPDDFVSQLGMSLVRDEQKDLDGAIWHMERAFEVNPSNAAVQGELRRLYGRRDGLEPPKIRLTRGALAYMYTKGGQYQQAIAEIKSVLAEDSTRVDMKVLMARALYRAGQKVEATEICIELLKEYPYCLEANRILVEVLPGTTLSQSLDTYKKRVQALDPYAALVTGSIFDVDAVPDNSVILERLEWDPDSAPQDSFAGSSAQPGEPIPDFLRSSGWGPSTGEFQEGHVDFGAEEPAAAAPSGLAAAEIPDWLKAMAPPGSSAAPAEQSKPATEQNLEPEDLDWLSGLGGPISGGGQTSQAAAPASSGDQPDWLKDMGGSPMDQPRAEFQSETAADDQPDWMKNLGTAAAAGATGVAADEGLDWLDALNRSSQPATPPPSAQPTAAPADDMDWLKNLGMPQATTSPEPAAPASQPAATPADDLDWLKNLGGPQAASPEPAAPVSAAPAAQLAATPADDLDWLKNLGGPQAASPEPAAPVSATPAAQPAATPTDDLDWLKNLGGPQTASPEPVAPVQPPPPPPVAPKKPVAQDDFSFVPGPLSALVSGPGTSASEQD